MAGPYPLNPDDFNLGFNPAQGDPYASVPPAGPPDPSNGLAPPDLGMPQFDPDSDPIVQKLQGQDAVDLNLDLGDEREQRLVSMILRGIDSWNYATRRRVENLSQWRLCHELMPPGTNTRWQNASDIPSPLTRITVNSHITRLAQQLNNATPPMTAKARKPEARDACPLIEDAMDAVLDQAEWPTVSEDMIREAVIAGNVFVRTGYRKKVARIPKRLVDHDEEARDAMMAAGVDPHEAVWHSFERVRFGHVDEPIYDGVEYKVIPFEDGVLWPPDCRDPEHAKGIGERIRICGADLLEGVRAGFYREAEVNELLEQSGDPEPQERIYRKDEQGLMQDMMGGAYVGSEERLYKQFEVYEVCVLYDGDDDDRLEWVVAHVHKDSRKLIGLRWMDYEHGRPYYSMVRYIRRTAELFGMGIPELIQAYHDGDTAVWNQIVDHNDLNLNIGGNFAYTRLSGYEPTKTGLQMGMPLKFENLAETEFKPLPPMPLPTEAYQLNGRFKDAVDLLTATSNPTLGKETTTNKTLGEVQIVTNAANQIFEYFAAGFAREVAKLWDMARWLTAQYGMNDDNQIVYRRTAAPDVIEFKTIDPKQLSADVDLVPTGITQLSDMGSRIQQATLVHAQVMQLMASIQAWLPFAPVVLISFGQYLKSLSYPLREKLLASLEQTIAQMMGQQMQAQQMAMMGAMGGAGLPPGAGPGGGLPAPPPGAIGGLPAPIPGPPELPEGATTQQRLPPPAVPA